VTAVVESALSGSPTEFRLEQNYPNPFYRAPAMAGAGFTITQIRYTLPQQEHVKLIIYDLYGRRVRILQDAEKNAGSYTQTWDGLDQFGAPVATGIYVYRLQTGQATLTRKMLMVE
jgi:flagellar hook assembly protein FlgD